jgi:hypothetical protein
VNMVTKAHILQEIKRTAEENDGTPLGMRRFESETGIKRYDWEKYWPRGLSEAIREAGYTPNQPSRPADIAAVLGKYAGLAQELGHLPIEAELLFKSRSDCTFPGKNAFKRFGTKLELVEHVAQYCRSHAVYDDVVRLCEEYVFQAQQESANESECQEEEIGFVYLIKSGRFYKIGRSNAAGRREYELAIQLPEKAEKIHVIRTDDPSGIETYWHKRFERQSEKMVNGPSLMQQMLQRSNDASLCEAPFLIPNP